MFSLEGVSLRPLEPDDINTLYGWRCDPELEILAGWGPVRSLAAFHEAEMKRLLEPPNDFVRFGISLEDRLVGYIDLGLIDHTQRRGYLGLVIGDRMIWGQGVGRRAVRLMLDYAFTPLNLERVVAEVYSFNARSLRLMESVGFSREGLLRQHEIHNGRRIDMVVYGILREEFYARYATIFPIPDR